MMCILYCGNSNSIHIIYNRWLVKKSREDEALKILSKIYKDEKRAKHQLEEIKSEVASTQELGSLLETVKYVCQWNIIQRYILL